MRVLIDIAAIARGGMERQVLQLAAGLSERGHDVLLVVQKAVYDYRDEIETANIEVVELGREGRYDARIASDLMSVVKRFQPDVIVCENFNATLWGRIVARSARIPVITAEHSSDRPRRRMRDWSNRVLGPHTHAIVACAEGQRAALVREGNPADRIRVIPNGVDTRVFGMNDLSGRAFRADWRIADEAFVVGLMAAHRSEKRHDRFLEVIRRASGDVPALVGLAVGGGPLLEQTRAMVGKSRLQSRLILTGAISDVVAAYSAMDVFALVSDSDTFPMSILEAQACGLPVVAMETGGVAETFEDGVSGFLVTQGNIEEFAERVISLAADAALRARMSRAGRKGVGREHSIDKMIDSFEALLTEAAGSES